jgi:DNA-binding beta-propeller fold protein YncE
MESCVGLALKLSRLARFAAVFSLLLIWAGCGDQFRPVATPIVPPPPDPLPTHFVFVVNRNGANDPSTTTRIDVAGDASLGVAKAGLGSVHAALVPNGSRVYVANSLEDTVSSYASTSINPVATTSLPLGSTPVFVHTTENSTMYVANIGSTTTAPSVAAISAATNAVTNNIALNFKPVVLSETPDGKKIYAVGSDGAGVGWVVSINSIDKSLNEAIKGLSAPVWVATRSDNQRAYVLNSGSGTVTTIDTFSDSVLPGDVLVGAGADFMLYDPKLNRLYISNPTAGTVSVLDASTDPPSSLTGAVTLPEYSPQTSSDPLNPCQGTAVKPTSIAALPDGTRSYVASYQLTSDGKQICSQVSVINTTNNTVTKTIGLEFTVPATGPLTTAVPVAPDRTGCASTRSPSSSIPPFIQNTGFRVSVASSADSSKVYVANCDAGSTSIVPTSSGAQTANVDSPFSDLPPVTTTVNISAASQSGTTTTYAYTLISGPPLRAGMSIAISGIVGGTNNPDDGTFSISAVGTGTFNAENPSGVAATGQNGTGTVTLPPPQDPVFILTGP